MEQKQLKQRLEDVARGLHAYYTGAFEVFPKEIQNLVEWSSNGRLVVAATDRYGNEFYPEPQYWEGMHHSFYRVKYSDGKEFHAVGELVVPQTSIDCPQSIIDCVKTLLQEYPWEGAVVRLQRSYIISTGNCRDLMQNHYEPIKVPLNGGFYGRSIMAGGRPVCDCSQKPCLSYGKGLWCERITIDPRDIFIG